MTLAELTDDIQKKVQDESIDTPTIIRRINEGVNFIAGRVLLPDLMAEATIYAGTARLVASTISFDAASKEIRDSANGFITGGFFVGSSITVDDSVANDGTYTIVDGATDGSYVIVAETLVDGAVGPAVTLTNEGPNNVPLPRDYMRNLYKCYSPQITQWMKVFTSHRVMFQMFTIPDLAGTIYYVAPQGTTRLYYQRIPSSPQDLTLFYYRKPVDMTDDDDIPDGIPDHLQFPLIYNWACKELFKTIEDGVEGPMVNTDAHSAEFNAAMNELRSFIGPDDEDSPEIIDEMCWDEMME